VQDVLLGGPAYAVRINRDILITYPDAEKAASGELSIYTPSVESLANFTDSFPRMLRSVCFLENHVDKYNVTRIITERDASDASFVSLLSDFFAYRKCVFLLLWLRPPLAPIAQ
jgi:hypothetical protein